MEGYGFLCSVKGSLLGSKSCVWVLLIIQCLFLLCWVLGPAVLFVGPVCVLVLGFREEGVGPWG